MMNENLKIKITEVLQSEYKMMLHAIDCMSSFQGAGYNGFKRMFEYFAYDRQKHIIRLRKFIGDTGHFYPIIAVNFPGFTGIGVVDTLQKTHDASKMHIELIQSAANTAIEANEHRIMGYLESMIKDQSDEEVLKCFRYIEKIQNAKSDPGYIQVLDCDLHEKYKNKLEKLEYKDWK